MGKIALQVLSFFVVIGISLVSMIWGWGLTPANWGWVCFGYVALLIPAGIQIMAEAS